MQRFSVFVCRKTALIIIDLVVRRTQSHGALSLTWLCFLLCSQEDCTNYD